MSAQPTPCLWMPAATRGMQASRETRKIGLARWAGYRLGLIDRHSTDANYQTSGEWRVWLEGWRAGQMDFKRVSAIRPVAESDVAESTRYGRRMLYLIESGKVEAGTV